MECLTASASSSCPSEKDIPSRSVQLYVRFDPSVKRQLSAASGSGADAPAG